MATTLNLKDRRSSGSSESRAILPTDFYRMKIIEAKLEEDQFADKNKDGSQPIKLVLTWEVSALTEEQQEDAAAADEDWSSVRIWQRLNPYYGTVKEGGPSKFKAFLDGLLGQGLLAGFNEEAFDIESLVGIEQRVSVEKYTKTMGVNAGQPGNKIVAIAPLRKPKSKATLTPEVEPNEY